MGDGAIGNVDLVCEPLLALAELAESLVELAASVGLDCHGLDLPDDVEEKGALGDAPNQGYNEGDSGPDLLSLAHHSTLRIACRTSA